MKKYLAITSVTVFLMGCYNIGSYTHYVQNNTHTTTAAHALPSHAHTKNTCTLYVPPVHPPLPDIPMDEIKRVSSHNTREVQSMLTAHIRALREYAVNKRKTDEQHYNKYLSECANMLK